VAADNAQAVQIARDVLWAGGTAADAAVALYFGLAVTQPADASLGAGGVCLLYDPADKRVRLYEFALRPSGVAGQTAVALPGAVAGMSALHNDFGRLRWAQLLSPAEKLARFGFRVSPALASALADAGAAFLEDAATRRVFGRRAGGPLRAGDMVVQEDLAETIDILRLGGARNFYSGGLAERFAEGVRQGGGTISVAELGDYQPRAGQMIISHAGGFSTHFIALDGSRGVLQAQLWSILVDDGRYADTPAEERPHLFIEAAARSAGGFEHWVRSGGGTPSGLLSGPRIGRLMTDYRKGRHTPVRRLKPMPTLGDPEPSGTGFVVFDETGTVVTCGLTLNRAFGTGRIATGTGVFPALQRQNSDSAALAPVMAIDAAGTLRYAAIGSGAAGPVAAVWVMLRTLILDESLPSALAATRLHHPGHPDRVRVEEKISRPRVATLTWRGHRMQRVQALGRVNAVVCAGADSTGTDRCRAQTDPRGPGAEANAKVAE
jgi:gamma-glutamyltranspeptidase/glutathione hydrolase